MVDRQRSLCWAVESPCTLADVMGRMDKSLEPVRDGRVFVDGKRCLDAAVRLERGAFVEVFHADSAPGERVEVLSSRKDLVAVYKPAGLSTIPDQRGRSASLLDAVARFLGERDMTRVHATSRLDREVSGVVVFAMGREAREAMKEARASHRYRRHYVALATRAPTPREGRIDVPIGRGRRATERVVNGTDAVVALTHHATIDESAGVAMVAVEPQTGRTHQIRVHMSHAGAPLVGDDKYGGSKRLVLATGAVVRVDRVALHAAWVEVTWPGGEPWRVDAPVADELKQLWVRVGGGPESWDRALRPLSPNLSSTQPAGRGRLDDEESDGASE
jgi:RluA family pseudouridine synthase